MNLFKYTKKIKELGTKSASFQQFQSQLQQPSTDHYFFLLLF